MNRVLLTAAFGAIAAFGSMSVAAAEVSGNVTLASDYSFRGISQTTRDPTIQGGFDVNWESGFYVGTWASNVNFGNSGAIELDYYVGWAGEIAEGIGIDLMAMRYEYPSEGASDYEEYWASFSLGDATLGALYSPKYGGGESFIYAFAGYSVGLPNEMSIDFNVGFNISDDPAFFSDGFSDEDTYIDYSAVLNIPVGGVDVGLGVYGTDIDDQFCGNDCEDRFILSLSKSL